MTSNVILLLIVLLFSILSASTTLVLASHAPTSIDGVISIENDILRNVHNENTLLVHLYQLDATGSKIPSVSQLHTFKPYSTLRFLNVNSSAIPFSFSNVAQGHQYALFALLNQEGQQQRRGRLGSEYVNIAGWYKSDKCGWLAPIRIDSGLRDATDIVIEMKGVRPFTANKRKNSSSVTVNGRLQLKKGLPVLNIWGSAKERGYAHGYLIAEQILDFFTYFILEGTAGSCSIYEKKWIPMIANSLSNPSADSPYYFEPEFVQEADAIIRGMQDSGVDMFLPGLGRNFLSFDILAINSYIELEFLKRDTSDSSSSVACTQFAFWNTQTKHVPGTYGNTIAGRNMDGELDIRRSTVTNFLVFSVSPTKGKKYVSMMWPGFIGTLSGVNEDGQYLMMNYGVSSNLNPVWSQVVPVNWIVRQLLAYPQVSIDKASAKTALAQIQQYNAKTGGPCITGCVLFFAKPYQNNSSESPAYVYEGDYKDGFMRLPAEADPTYLFDAILASNHYHKYGVDPTKGPNYNFGRFMYFDTLVRYQAGNYKVKSYNDVQAIQGRVNQVRVQEVLQTVAHGTTEHSIVYRIVDNSIFIDIALAHKYDTTSGWDAPYLEWLTFQFEDLFA